MSMKDKFIAEFIGTAFLIMIVVGSGIMAQKLFDAQDGLSLMANSLATGLGLFALIQALGPISGSHMNPVVSLVEMLWGNLTKKEALFYILAQCTGAYVGILLTHLMFNLEVFQLAEVDRSGSHLFMSEVIATFGLICIIALSGRKHVELAPLSIAAYITSAYWFTASTSFANPALTYGRMFTNTFGGIAPAHFLPFVLSQISGAILAWVVLRGLEIGKKIPNVNFNSK